MPAFLFHPSSQAYAEHAGKARGEVELDDVMLAIQLNASTSFVPPPSQDVLLELAEKINKAPIPEPKKQFGLHLPPDEHCLTNPNYQVPSGASLALPVSEVALPAPSPAEALDTAPNGPGPAPPPPGEDGYAGAGASISTAVLPEPREPGPAAPLEIADGGAAVAAGAAATPQQTEGMDTKMDIEQ
mmetsp:Transcript_29271/g.82580  ORF Transcript_29271/g.82580 Transcript_29271/m.82580 type:complete len:186 (-) Transcript_29271:316-873(-)